MVIMTIACSTAARARPGPGCRRILFAGALWLLSLAAGTSHADVGLALAPSPSNLPVYLAQSKGYFAAEGVEVRLIDCVVGKLCLRLLLDGKADLCTVADLPIALAGFGREPFFVVATINTDRNDTKIVTRRGSGVLSIADLHGRRVGTVVGTTAQYVLDSWLLMEGADPARVSVVNIAPGEAGVRLLVGSVDAVAVFEPYASDAARSLGTDAHVFESRHLYTQTVNLVMPPAARAPSPDDLQAVLRALDRAAQLIVREPAIAKAELRERLNLDPALIDQTWRSLNYEIGLNQSLITTLEGEARWARRLGTAAGPIPNYLDFVDTRPLRRVRPGSVLLVK